MFIHKIKNYKIIQLGNKGFTLIEMLVTLGIVTLLSTMILAYSRKSESVSNLVREGNRIVFEIQEAKNSAMLTLQKDNLGEKRICGWGIHFDQDLKNSFIVFQDFCIADTGDLEGSGDYDEEGEMVETIELLKNVEIFETNVSSIVFVPPEPKIIFKPELFGSEEASIKIGLKERQDQYFEIRVSPVGQIYKQLITNQ